MSSTWRVASIVALTSVALVIALVFLADWRVEPAPDRYRGNVLHDAAEVAEEYRPLAEHSEIHGRFLEAAAEMTDLAPQERDQIAVRAAKLTSIFLGGTLDEYRQALAEQGLPASAWMTEADAEQVWAQAQRNFESSVVNLDGVTMHAPVVDMYIRKGVAGLKNEMIARVFNKPVGPGNVHPLAAEAVLRDVVVPLTLKTTEGTTFQAELVLGFGLRESDGQWVLVSVRINDIPSNESIHRMMI